MDVSVPKKPTGLTSNVSKPSALTRIPAMDTQVLIEGWWQHYNRVRPHSTLGYRPPAPEA